MGNISRRHYNSEFSAKRRMKPNHKALILWHLIAAWYYVSTSFCDGAQNNKFYGLVDLTHVFDKDTIYWVTEPSLTLNVTYNGTIPGKDYWYQKDEIYAATHGGTHMDAPCHFAKGRWCVSDVPLENLVVQACVVDISHHVNGNPDIHLTKDMVLEWEENHGRIPEQSLLLIYTGWSQFWPNRTMYSGTESRDVSSLKFPSIKREVADWLVTNRVVVGVGIDTMSVDIPAERPGTHVTLMKNNIYGLENVNNIDKLPPTGAVVYVSPMKLRDASGAPVRLIAQVPESSGTSVGSKTCHYLTHVVAIVLLIYICML